MPQISRNGSLHEKVFYRGSRKWGFSYDGVYNKGKTFKVGEGVGDRVVEKVEEVMCMVVEEVEVLLQI